HLSFAKPPVAPVTDEPAALPDEALDRDNPYGFIGRDGDLLAIERALRGRAAGILLHGLGGVGKTTLARGLLGWLKATDGLGHGSFWFTFQDIRSAEFVVNRMGEGVLGGQFPALPRIEHKIELLARALRERRVTV